MVRPRPDQDVLIALFNDQRGHFPLTSDPEHGAPRFGYIKFVGGGFANVAVGDVDNWVRISEGAACDLRKRERSTNSS